MASVILWLGKIFTVLSFVMALIIIILAHVLGIKINGTEIKLVNLDNTPINVDGKSIIIPNNVNPLVTKNIVVSCIAVVLIVMSIFLGETKKNKKMIGIIMILILIGFFISLVILFIESIKIDYQNIGDLKTPLSAVKYVEWAICASGALGFILLGMSSLYKLL